MKKPGPNQPTKEDLKQGLAVLIKAAKRYLDKDGLTKEDRLTLAIVTSYKKNTQHLPGGNEVIHNLDAAL